MRPCRGGAGAKRHRSEAEGPNVKDTRARPLPSRYRAPSTLACRGRCPRAPESAARGRAPARPSLRRAGRRNTRRRRCAGSAATPSWTACGCLRVIVYAVVDDARGAELPRSPLGCDGCDVSRPSGLYGRSFSFSGTKTKTNASTAPTARAGATLRRTRSRVRKDRAPRAPRCVPDGCRASMIITAATQTTATNGTIRPSGLGP